MDERGEDVKMVRLAVLVLVFHAILSISTGCRSNPHRTSEAQLQFQAGQDAAFATLQQSGIYVVRLAGPFERPALLWQDGMTLAQAILQAGYLSEKEPTQIIIQRGPNAIDIKPDRLLAGEEIPVESGDIIHVLP